MIGVGTSFKIFLPQYDLRDVKSTAKDNAANTIKESDPFQIGTPFAKIIDPTKDPKDNAVIKSKKVIWEMSFFPRTLDTMYITKKAIIVLKMI
jgi:hypothetical protein